MDHIFSLISAYTRFKFGYKINEKLMFAGPKQGIWSIIYSNLQSIEK